MLQGFIQKKKKKVNVKRGWCLSLQDKWIRSPSQFEQEAPGIDLSIYLISQLKFLRKMDMIPLVTNMDNRKKTECLVHAVQPKSLLKDFYSIKTDIQYSFIYRLDLVKKIKILNRIFLCKNIPAVELILLGRIQVQSDTFSEQSH